MDNIKKKRNTYCAMCRSVIKELYGKPKYDNKFYPLCSKVCYNDYINKVWIPENGSWQPQKYVRDGDYARKESTGDKAENGGVTDYQPHISPANYSKVDIEEFPDY